MEVDIQEHIIRRIIVAPKSRIDAFNGAELRAHLDGLLAGGAKDFVLDLSAVPFIDSSGMAVLVSLLKRARQAGGDVKLVWPREEAAQRILKLTKFDRVFEMVDDVPTALHSF